MSIQLFNREARLLQVEEARNILNKQGGKASSSAIKSMVAHLIDQVKNNKDLAAHDRLSLIAFTYFVTQNFKNGSFDADTQLEKLGRDEEYYRDLTNIPYDQTGDFYTFYKETGLDEILDLTSSHENRIRFNANFHNMRDRMIKLGQKLQAGTRGSAQEQRPSADNKRDSERKRVTEEQETKSGKDQPSTIPRTDIDTQPIGTLGDAVEQHRLQNAFEEFNRMSKLLLMQQKDTQHLIKLVEGLQARMDETHAMVTRALNRSEDAYNLAQQAMGSANNANTQALKAAERADRAHGRADEAYGHADVASGRASNAQGRADQAYDRADSGLTLANTANENAQHASRTATAAHILGEQANTRLSAVETTLQQIEARANTTHSLAESADSRSKDAAKIALEALELARRVQDLERKTEQEVEATKKTANETAEKVTGITPALDAIRAEEQQLRTRMTAVEARPAVTLTQVDERIKYFGS